MPDARRRFAAALVLAAGLLVAWVRLLPLSLAALDDAGLRAERRYEGADGRSHVYLGDFDSYHWLRSARNVLRSGSVCDAVVDGDCRDALAHAPVGRSMMRYRHSAHIAAIVALHRAITWFDPPYPLPATAFLVPVIVGTLAVVPAFALGRRLAGTLGGLCAALLIGLNPLFLYRSLGSDNDVWNVTLPLFMVWAAVAALDAPTARGQTVRAVLAALLAALHAATWRGWELGYAVLLGALAAVMIIFALRAARGSGEGTRAALRRTALVAGVFYVATGLFVSAAGIGRPYLRIPADLVSSALREVTLGAAESGGSGETWPDALATVSETARPNLRAIADAIGGLAFFQLGWLGLLVLLLPRTPWQWWHFTVVIAGTYLGYYLLTAPAVDRTVLLGVLACPLATTIILKIAEPENPAPGDLGTALIVVLWFLAALAVCFAGIRFVMLLVSPFALAAAVAIGRACEWLSEQAATRAPRYRRAARALPMGLGAALLLVPIQRGYVTARSYVPPMHDAWWDTLSELRERTPPETIITTWWDYGYWVKYVAERRVSADGGSVRTRIPHWIARALLAPSEAETIGWLRMLDCASDAAPEREGQRGAIARLLETGVPEGMAYTMLAEVIGRDRAAANEYLAQHGLAEPVRADLLALTHCTPPPAQLVLDSAVVESAAVRQLGNWRFERAYAVQRAHGQPRDAAIAEMGQALGLSARGAAALFERVAALRGLDEARAFVAPSDGYLTAAWQPCLSAPEGTSRVCPLDIRDVSQGHALVEFVYEPAAPAHGRLRVRRDADPPGAGLVDAPPATILIAADDGVRELAPPGPVHHRIAVLVDLARDRILVGAPDQLRSTLTRLMYLDARGLAHFREFSERTAATGRRVVSWAINWDDAGVP